MEHFKELDKRFEEGYLRRVVSPCEKLVLYNYTDKCTYERAWDEYTLNARGTVYERSTGKVIARAFPKFFNLGELPVEKQQALLLKTSFDVYEKMDGSLGIVYFYEGAWRVNTRGSFTSDQAVKATEMLGKYNLSRVPKDITLLAEIIYPENKIIVDYGKEEKLVLLGAYQEGIDLTEELTDLSNLTTIPVAPRIAKFAHLSQLIEEQEKLPAGEEGFVVRFSDGERVKFKGIEYLKVARILQGCSPLTFWESMINGRVCVKLLESIPEEFREEYESIAKELEYRYVSTYTHAEAEYLGLTKKLALPLLPEGITNEHRKKVGIYLKENSLNHEGSMFSFLLGQPDRVDKYVMGKIKPVANVL